jgi:hypothetical protein
MGKGRRKKRLDKSRNKSKLNLLKFLIPVVILLIGFLYLKLNTRYWNGLDKLSIVSQNDDGSVSVKIHDPVLGEVTTLVVPGDTEVAVSENLGTLRLKNVWQLGINEKIGGKLLTQTVTKNFLFPSFLFNGPGNTNVPVGDRLLIWIFEQRTKNLQRTEIDLAEAQFFKKQKLSDGETGYRLSGGVSERLIAYFSDNDWQKKEVKIYIKDATGAVGVADTFGRVLEVMGGKVVTIEKMDKDQSLDCKVIGKDKKVIAKIIQIFGCRGEGSPRANGFDLEISLGEKFAQKF